MPWDTYRLTVDELNEFISQLNKLHKAQEKQARELSRGR